MTKPLTLLIIMLFQLIFPIALVYAHPIAPSQYHNYTNLKLYDREKFLLGPYYLTYIYKLAPNPPYDHRGDFVYVYKTQTNEMKLQITLWGGPGGGINTNGTFYDIVNGSRTKVFTWVYKSGQAIYDSSKDLNYVILDILNYIYEVRYEATVTANPSLFSLTKPGQVATFTVTIKNTGTLPIESVSYFMFPPPGAAITFLTDQSDPTQGSFYNLDVGESKTLTYTVTTNQTSEYGIYQIPFTVTYTNKFSETGETHTTYIIQVEIGEKRGPVGIPNVVANIITSKSTLLPGGSATVTVNIQNLGNGTAYHNAIYIYSQPSDLTFIFQNPASKGTVTGGLEEPIRLVFQNGSEAPLVSGGMIASPIKFTVKVPEYSITGEKQYKVFVKLVFFDAEGKGYNNTYSTTFTVVEPGRAIISVTKTVSAAWVGLGGRITIDIVVKNEGSGTARNVKITDEYPNLYFTLKAGSVSQTLQKLDPGETYTLSYELEAVNLGSVILGEASVEYLDELNNEHLEHSNPGGLVSIVNPNVKVKLIKYPNQTLEVGTSFTYAVELTNEGNGQALDVKFAIKIPSGIEILSLTPSNLEVTGQRIIYLIL